MLRFRAQTTLGKEAVRGDGILRHGPHRGLRVLDLSDRLSGAFAARLFADFGAEVLLAESRQGHVLRHEGPHFAEVSSIHAYAN